MGSLARYIPTQEKYNKRCTSGYREFDHLLGKYTISAFIYENIIHQCKNNLPTTGEIVCYVSSKSLSKRFECTPQAVRDSLKKIQNCGLIKLEKMHGEEIYYKDNIRIDCKISVLKIPKLEQDFVYKKSKDTLHESKDTLHESKDTLFSNPSPALINQGSTEISNSPTVLQHITTYNNPPSPLFSNSNSITVDLTKSSANANAFASPPEKSIDEEKIPQQLTLETQLNVEPELDIPIPGKKKSRRKIDYEDNFTQWWNLYPVNKNKECAFGKFKGALQKIPFDQLMEATKAYIAVREREIENDPRKSDSHTYTPYPERWLKYKRWEDQSVQAELEKRQSLTSSLPGKYQPPSEEIIIMANSKFDRIVKEKLAKLLTPETYKAWIENTEFEALGFDDYNNPQYKTNSRFSEDYIDTHYREAIKQAYTFHGKRADHAKH